MKAVKTQPYVVQKIAPRNPRLSITSAKRVESFETYSDYASPFQVGCRAPESISGDTIRTTTSNGVEESPSIGYSAKDDRGGCCAIQEVEEDDLSDDGAESVHNQNQDTVKEVLPQLQVGAETKVEHEEMDDRAEVLKQWETIDQVGHTALEPSGIHFDFTLCVVANTRLTLSALDFAIRVSTPYVPSAQQQRTYPPGIFQTLTMKSIRSKLIEMKWSRLVA